MLATLDTQTAQWLAELEAWERRRGGSAEAARARLARDVGLSAGSLERIRRRRIKGVRFYVVETIRRLYIAALSREQARLAQALALAECVCGELDPDAAGEARTALEQAARLIARAASAP